MDAPFHPSSRLGMRRAHRRRSAWIVAVATLGTVALVLVGLLALGDSTNSRSTAAHARATSGSLPPVTSGTGSTPSTVAPVTTTSTTSTTAPSASPFTAQVQAYLQTRQGDATATVYDVATGKEWDYRPGDIQDTASIVKVDIMAALMAQQTAAGRPIPDTDQSLLKSMIEVSDNGAATSLWNAVGGPTAIDAFNRSIGLTSTTASTCLQCSGFAWPGWGLTTTTAADQVRLLRTVAFPYSGISADDRAEAVNLLESVVPSENWGVSGGVPSGVTVALKNGWCPCRTGCGRSTASDGSMAAAGTT
jgi:beta-lactamase class A